MRLRMLCMDQNSKQGIFCYHFVQGCIGARKGPWISKSRSDGSGGGRDIKINEKKEKK